MWIALRQALWPYEPPDALAQEAAAMDDDQRAWVRLVFDERGEAVGLLEFSVRDQSPGSGGRALPYVEGWYVTPAVRRQGVGRMLIAHLETWAVVHGYRQIASDTIPALFPDSTAAHLALGFAIVDEGPDEDGDQARFFHKPLL
jgi:aminoglycoside 6'-N-acetyltransferase I